MNKTPSHRDFPAETAKKLAEVIEAKQKKLASQAEFIETYFLSMGLDPESADDPEKRIRNLTFLYTECGAWFRFTETGVALGSIIEGVEQVTQVQTLDYPFTINQYWQALEKVEAEASEIWDNTHGCPDCGPEDPETGYIPVNPNCENCGGEGKVI